MSQSSDKKLLNADKKLLGFWDLMGISLGQIIGTGVVVLTGISISMTGYGVPWAFVLALGIVAIPSLCIAALGSAIPSTGGNYTYVRELLGHKTSFVYLALLVAGQVILASFAIGFAQYADALLPGVNMMMVAAGVMVLCYIANLLGLKTAARFQNIMVLILLVSLLCYIAFGLPHVNDFSNYTKPEHIFPSGIAGFFVAAFLLRLSLIGSEFVSEFGGEMKNPGKLIPRVMGWSLLVVTLLYVGISIVASGVLPLADVEGKNLAAVAKVIFSPIVYTAFIAGGVMISLITSLNAIFAWCTRGLSMASADGWLPENLAVTNRFGTPYIFLSLFFVVGITPILTGMTLDYVSILGNTFGAIFGLFPVVAIINLTNKKPEAYRNAPFKLPVLATKILPILAVIIYGYGIYTSWDFIGLKGMAGFGIYTAFVIAYAVWREPIVKTKLTYSD